MDDNSTIKNNSKSRRGFLQDIPKWIGLGALFAAAGNIFTSSTTKAQDKPESLMGADPFLGEIELVGFTFAPNGWYLCDGQLLLISSNPALFSLLGTTYGGNGVSTFALPDLRGRFAVHPGNGITLGATGGSSQVTLLSSQIPSHTHSLNVSSGGGTSDNPSTNYLAANSEGIKQYSSSTNATANAASIDVTGGGVAHDNMPPYLGINHIIAWTGIFPSRP